MNSPSPIVYYRLITYISKCGCVEWWWFKVDYTLQTCGDCTSLVLMSENAVGGNATARLEEASVSPIVSSNHENTTSAKTWTRYARWMSDKIV